MLDKIITSLFILMVLIILSPLWVSLLIVFIILCVVLFILFILYLINCGWYNTKKKIKRIYYKLKDKYGV